MTTTTIKPSTRPPPPLPSSPSSEENKKSIVEVLSYPISLLERIRKAVGEEESFKLYCSEVVEMTNNIGEMLSSAVLKATATSPGSFYERPIRRIVAVVSRNFEEAITLVRKYRRRRVLRRVTVVSTADFRKLLLLLENSVADMKWLLNVFDGGTMLSLPPIASNDPIFSWIWASIATLCMGQIEDRIDAANQLGLLAQDNDRNKKIIVKEGGVPPLLKLLKDAPSVDAQMASATALLYLANDEEGVYSILVELGVPIIVQVLGDSPAEVQIKLANLVARMAKHSSHAKEDFGRENVIKPLVTLLSRDVFVDVPNFKIGKHSLINMELLRNQLHGGFGSWEDPEVKISCAEALGMLARGSVLNSRRITETKGLLCLAKLVEKTEGELSYNCVRAIMEITAAAETNSDLRRAAFKTNSPAAKAVVNQLLQVITVSDSPSLQIPAIKSIGSLARTFPARETRVIGPLVGQLSNRDHKVAAEAAIALEKFACPDNFLCVEHSKTIIQFGGLEPLMRLFRGYEQTGFNSLILLCYLVLHARNIEAQNLARVLNILEAAGGAPLGQQPEHGELISEAVFHLKLYHSGLCSKATGN